MPQKLVRGAPTGFYEAPLPSKQTLNLGDAGEIVLWRAAPQGSCWDGQPEDWVARSFPQPNKEATSHIHSPDLIVVQSFPSHFPFMAAPSGLTIGWKVLKDSVWG